MNTVYLFQAAVKEGIAGDYEAENGDRRRAGRGRSLELVYRRALSKPPDRIFGSTDGGPLPPLACRPCAKFGRHKFRNGLASSG